jgi:hypothetical protein
MPRMNILNAVEQEAFESAPVFTAPIHEARLRLGYFRRGSWSAES